MSGLTARGSRRGNTCQAGGARASAAMARRIAALPQSRATGQADAMAILMRRTLMRTSAPIFKNLRRMVPQVALAKAVLRRPIRRRAQSSTSPSSGTRGAADWRASWPPRFGRHRDRAGTP